MTDGLKIETSQGVTTIALDDPKTLNALTCSIPDDHIDPRRWALFAARWVLGDSRKEKRHARTTA